MEDHRHNNIDLTDIAEAILVLKTKDEIDRFLTDLCTPQEIDALNERWHVCQLLHNSDLSYRMISELSGVSTTTVTRVSRFLNNEPYKGYKTVLERIKDVKKSNNDSNDATKRSRMRKEK